MARGPVHARKFMQGRDFLLRVDQVSDLGSNLGSNFYKQKPLLSLTFRDLHSLIGIINNAHLAERLGDIARWCI